MKRMLHWTDGFAPAIGGTELLVLELAKAQARAGHEVHVVAESLPNCPDEEVFEGIPVHRFPFTPTLLARTPAALRELIDRLVAIRSRLQPDNVHVHFNGAAAWFEQLSRASGPLPILTVHSPPDCLRVPVPLRRHILRSAGWVVAVSRAQEAEFAAFEPGLHDSLACVPNGFPIPPIPPGKRSLPEPKPFRFAALGRLVETKGFHVALEAFARVHALHPDSCELWIAGDGTERPRLLGQTEALGPASRHITFPGWIAPHDVHAWIQEADALLVPSTWQEPFGLVAVQAAFAACPVIASNVGGLAEIVRHGETGWLIPHSDPDALATAMAACMAAPEAARSLGVNARQQALAHFSIERCRADYERLYNSPRPTPGSSPTHENPLLV
jgi:glycogen(starch) synthase